MYESFQMCEAMNNKIELTSSFYKAQTGKLSHGYFFLEKKLNKNDFEWQHFNFLSKRTAPIFRDIFNEFVTQFLMLVSVYPSVIKRWRQDEPRCTHLTASRSVQMLHFPKNVTGLLLLHHLWWPYRRGNLSDAVLSTEWWLDAGKERRCLCVCVCVCVHVCV